MPETNQLRTDQKIKLLDGRVLVYREYGDSQGKPLFFFHGWPSSRLRGDHFDQAAKSAKIRLISIDRPGYGLSDFKENRTLLDWPDDVVELADKLKINKFAIVGVSGGGPYAAVTAYKIPDRITKAGYCCNISSLWR
jgi:pimeloyl-ACP methyl ester carboxylesterase